MDNKSILEKLANGNSKPKSDNFINAIDTMKNNEDVIYERAKKIEEVGNEAFLNFEEYMKSRGVK